MDTEMIIQNLQEECNQLRKENAYLKKQIAKLIQQQSLEPKSSMNNPLVTKHSPLQLKINLYKSLFKGRTDLYARRYESKSGKSGYTPACAYEWQQPICLKPAINCSNCEHRTFLPLTDQVIAEHLGGKQVIGLYPMYKDETCSFLAVDFDKQNWQDDVKAFIQVCKDIGIPFSIERSRSGNGAHVWFFFANYVKASIARKLGISLLSKTLEKRYQIGIDSYDRMFPNQDTLSKKGLGNLIALPLQRHAAINGNSLFVDDQFTPYPDQWIYLSNIQKITETDISTLLKKLGGETIQETQTSYNLPKKLTVLMKNGLFIKKDKLHSSLMSKLINLGCMNNPAFYKAQKNRLSTNGIPRILNFTDEDSEFIILPRGCQAELETLLKEFGIEIDYVDSRYEGNLVDATFSGELTSLQIEAISQLLSKETGVLAATTGFGKTVTAAALIAERGINTLIIVNRTQLQQQWIEKLSNFLNISPKEIGQIGGGKKNITGKIDLATIQSLTNKQEIKSFITQYGQIIIDECHHISAFTFERVLKQVRAKYIYGLTATPIRKDGLHPIIFMQCGPVRYKVDSKTQAKVRPFVHRLIIRHTEFSTSSTDVQDIYHQLSIDDKRNEQVFNDVLNSLEEARSPIVLTERLEHLEYLKNQFKGFAKNIIVLTGNMSKKEQKEELSRLASIPENEERLVLATGKYIGEGFDDPRLDTLFLAMPISWKGTLQQYVGRLHRVHSNKQEVRVYEYVDSQVPILDKMFNKRMAGYKMMGYVTESESSNKSEQMKLF